jgi:threonine/homoserine/homoserine lactone efflux protein
MRDAADELMGMLNLVMLGTIVVAGIGALASGNGAVGALILGGMLFLLWIVWESPRDERPREPKSATQLSADNFTQPTRRKRRSKRRPLSAWERW